MDTSTTPGTIPDLRDLTLDEIAELPITDEVLARVVAAVSGVPVAAFQSAI
jgi:FXSXX-COOH protein